MMSHPDELSRRVRRYERRARLMRGVESISWVVALLCVLALAVVAIDGAVIFDVRALGVARVVVPILVALIVAAIIVRARRRAGKITIHNWAQSHGLDGERAESVWSIAPERGVRGALGARARDMLAESAGPVERSPASGSMWSALASAAVVLVATVLSWDAMTTTALRLWSPSLAPPAWSEPLVELELNDPAAPVGSTLRMRAITGHDVGDSSPALLLDGVPVPHRAELSDGAALWRFEMPARRSLVSVEWGEARSRPVALRPSPEPVLESWTLRVEGIGAAVFDGGTRAVAVEAEDGAAVSLHARMAARPAVVRSSAGEARADASGFAWFGLAVGGETVTLLPTGPVVPGAGRPRSLAPPITLSFVLPGQRDTPAADGPPMDAVLASPDSEPSVAAIDAGAERTEATELEPAGETSEQIGSGVDLLDRTGPGPIESVDPGRPEPSAVPSKGVVDSVSGAPNAGAAPRSGWRAELIRAYVEELQRLGLSVQRTEEEG